MMLCLDISAVLSLCTTSFQPYLALKKISPAHFYHVNMGMNEPGWAWDWRRS
ncbi:hypothetical protein HanIR_Chr14g0675281 [Helianthus annuus]|nr:hypothetical protein HanIR_Chr14g0675281 [Helianthus annuus]